MFFVAYMSRYIAMAKGWATQGWVHMGSQVPSPTRVSKSQHGDKDPTFEHHISI